MSTTDSRKTPPSASRRLAVLLLVCFSVVVLGLSYSIWSVRAETSGAQTSAAEGSAAARGEYLANRVAMCVQCHSGRDVQGNLLESEKFKGGAIPVKTPYLSKEWAVRAPALAGLPGFTDAQVIALLTEGKAADRPAPRAPMPPFRLSRPDAEAIVAYLRTR
jgi:mono/diheme cytochrome c family protein